MRHVYFISSDGGTWYDIDIHRVIPFRKIYQLAKGLEEHTGKFMKLILVEKDGSESDITEWVYKKAEGLR